MNGEQPMTWVVWLLPLMLLVHFLASATPIPSWRLILSAGAERPQFFWARSESVMAEDSAQVLSLFHLRQVMLAWCYPACTFAISYSFSPSQLTAVGSYGHMSRQVGWTAEFQFSSSSSCPLDKLRNLLGLLSLGCSCTSANCAVILSGTLFCPEHCSLALPERSQRLLSQLPMASASASPPVCVHNHGWCVHVPEVCMSFCFYVRIVCICICECIDVTIPVWRHRRVCVHTHISNSFCYI